MYCKECGQEFKRKRNTRLYCSTKCRKLAFLKVEQNVKDSVPGAIVSVPSEVSVPGEFVTLKDTFYGHRISVTVPADWSADKKASALVKAKIPFYPKPGENIDAETGQERNKYADPAAIW